MRLNESVGVNVDERPSCDLDETAALDLRGAGPRLWAISALAVINIVCYGATLGCTFHADDAFHLPYLSRVFSGEYGLLLANFVSNWMQHLGVGLFYRPVLELTLALDFLIWRTNPFGYHLTNLLYQVATTIVMYFLCLRLLKEHGGKNELWIAFLSAALFAASPLHPEVTTWIIGRTDGFCTLMSMLSILLFLIFRQERKTGALAASLCAFIIALLSKENAIIVPPTLALFLLTETARKEKTPGKRVIFCLKTTWPYFAVVAAYLVLRQNALGTIFGGYQGSINECLSRTFIERWVTGSSWWMLLLPFNRELINDNHLLSYALRAVYAMLGVILLLRAGLMPLGKKELYVLGIITAWFLITLMPAYQVFSISPSLVGSRFVYLSTVPLYMLIVFLLVPFRKSALSSDNENDGQIESSLSLKFTALSISLLIGLILLFVPITMVNNNAWIEGSRVASRFKQSVADCVREGGASHKVVVASLPCDWQGAHLFYNFHMLNELIKPPLTADRIQGRVMTAEPLFSFGTPVRSANLMDKIARPDEYKVVFWDASERSLKPLEMPYSLSGPDELPAVTYPARLQGKYRVVTIEGLGSLSPALVDSVDITLSGAAPAADKNDIYIFLSWAKDKIQKRDEISALKLKKSGPSLRYSFPVSEKVSWLSLPKAKELKLFIPEKAGDLAVRTAFFRLSNTSRPVIREDANHFKERLDGAIEFAGETGTLFLDARNVRGAAAMAIEISNVDYFFQHEDNTFRHDRFARQALKRIPANNPSAHLKLDKALFHEPGYYQVRAFALSASGKIIGCASDPVQLFVDGKPVKSRDGNDIAEAACRISR